MDYELFENSSGFTVSYYDYDSDTDIEHSAETIIFSTFCFLQILLDILLIFVYLYFKRLHTVPNMFLVNWLIADVICLLLRPAFFHPFVKRFSFYETHYFCFIEEIESSNRLAICSFQTLLVIDWCVENFWPSKNAKWKDNYKNAIVGAWAPIIFFTVLSTKMCVDNTSIGKLSYQILLLFYLIFGVVVVALNITKCICKIRKRSMIEGNYMLTAVTINVILTIVSDVILGEIYGAYLIPNYFGVSIIFILFCISDSELRLSLRQLFTCKFNNDGYNRENLSGIYCRRCQETLH